MRRSDRTGNGRDHRGVPVRPGETAAPEQVARRLHAAALRALARRPRSAREIEQLLAARCDDPGLVAGEMERLAGERLLDDGAVADAVSRDAARRGLGSRRVRRALGRRGVERTASESAVDDAAARDAEVARALLARRFPGGIPADPRGRARALRLLASRGFPGGAARRALGIDVDIDLDGGAADECGGPEAGGDGC